MSKTNQNPEVKPDCAPLGLLAAIVQCLTVLQRIDRDNLTVGTGTIQMTTEGIEPPLYGQMQDAIKASEAAIAANAELSDRRANNP